jgi:hypothetical protein
VNRTVGGILPCICVLALLGCSAQADIAASERAVEEFRALLAAQQHEKIYSGSSSELKQSVSQADLDKLLDAIHRKLGKVSAAQPTAWHVNVNTAGTFVTLGYQTTFEHGEATERFVYRIEDGKARLVSYQINSLALVAD